jgi:hypothetical protein
VRPRDHTPVHVELKPGDYFVVAALNEKRFHEVLRHVPSGKADLTEGGYNHRGWKVKGGEVELPSVQIPPEGVYEDMALVDGGQSSFYMDCREFTIEDAARFARGTPMSGAVGVSSAHDHAITCNFDRAIQFAEEAGKRLPTLDEYRLAASHRTTEARGSTERADEPRDFGPAGIPLWDSTDTLPPILGLYSNVAEWTTTRERLVSGLAYQFVFGGDQTVVDGDPTLVPEHREAAVVIAQDRTVGKTGLGFRCVRSTMPHYLTEER